MADASPLTGSPSLNAALGGTSSPLGGAPPIDFNALISKQEEQTKAFQAKTEETEKSISEDVEKGHAATFDFVDAAKKAGEAFKQPPPVEKDRSPLEGFGSTAGILAAFGSLLTRQPLTNALNASAGVMNAYKAQDMAKFQQQMDAYKINIENAKTMYQLQSDTYNAIINDNKMSISAKQAALSAYAAAYKDESMQQLGDYKMMVQQSQFRDKLMEQMIEHSDKIDIDLKRISEKQAADEARATGNPNAQAFTNYMRDNPNATPEQQAAFIQSLRGTRSAATAAVQKFMQENPDATAEDLTKFTADYGQRVAAAKAFGTGKQGDIARSLNVSVSHLETLRELGRALDNGDVTAINNAKQRWAEEFGQPAPTNFDTAKAIVADEVAKGVIGGQSAQSDRSTLADSLRRERSFAAIEGSINTFQSLLAGQLSGLRQQYERTTKMKDFDETFLNDMTKQALGREKLPKGGGGGPPKIKTADDWEKLPPGPYIDPEGVQRIKQ